jgi:hypothetical protein
MDKKKTTYYQAICYTTDHEDGDLIAPACWEPTASLTEAAIQLMKEIEDSFSDKICTAKQPGPDYLVLECKHNSVNSCEWDYKTIKNWKRNRKYIQQLQNWLASGEIDTIRVTVPAYLNFANVQVEERADVFYINHFSL